MILSGKRCLSPRKPDANLRFVKPYEEIVQFIASLSPREVVAFAPSESARQRVWELIERPKGNTLATEEKDELDHYLEIEHIMRLAKARARQVIANGH